MKSSDTSAKYSCPANEQNHEIQLRLSVPDSLDESVSRPVSRLTRQRKSLAVIFDVFLRLTHIDMNTVEFVMIVLMPYVLQV